jgi:SPOR domain
MELARLIGQSDPFGPPPARSGDSPRRPDLPTRGPMARPLSREISPGLDRYEGGQEREEPARGHPFPSLQTFPTRSFAADDRGDDGHPEPARADAPSASHERFEFPAIGASEPGRAPRGAAAYPSDTYPDDTYPTVPDQHHPAEPESAHAAHMEDDRYPRLGSARQEALHPDAAYPKEGEHEGAYDTQYADAEGDAEADRYDEYEYADGDEGAYEDDESGGKRRNTIKIALAVLGVVVFGSAAAFGYRAVFHGGTGGPPPLIRADNSPTKVVPAPSADGSSKPINDRLGGERMVSREEQPVDLRDAARNANGGLVVPQAGGGAGVSPYPAAPVAGAAAPASPTEPKRVRTVTIHADPAAPPAAAGQVTPPATPAPAPRTAAVPRPVAQPAQAAAAPQAAPPNQPAAPLALTPQSQPSVAAVDTARPAAPARAAPRAVEGGGWMVQLSAQKTEAEAQSAFRVAQTKYSVLSGYQPQIRKKDRGERGIFYGAQVGPFAHEEANQLCDNLKGAGSDCFVLKN